MSQDAAVMELRKVMTKIVMLLRENTVMWNTGRCAQVVVKGPRKLLHSVPAVQTNLPAM